MQKCAARLTLLQYARHSVSLAEPDQSTVRGGAGLLVGVRPQVAVCVQRFHDEIWVRESDGYIVQLAFSGAFGNFTTTFDSYNKGPLITVPK